MTFALYCIITAILYYNRVMKKREVLHFYILVVVKMFERMTGNRLVHRGRESALIIPANSAARPFCTSSSSLYNALLSSPSTQHTRAVNSLSLSKAARNVTQIKRCVTHRTTQNRIQYLDVRDRIALQIPIFRYFEKILNF